MKAIRFLIKESPRRFAVAVLVAVMAGGSSSALLHAIALGLRGATPNVGLLFAVLILVQGTLAVLSHAVLMRLAARIVGDLRMRIARAALTAPFPRLEKVGLSRVRTAMIEDGPAVGSVSGLLVTAIISAATLLGAFSYLIWLSPATAASTLVIAVLAWLAYRRLSATGIRTMIDAMRNERPRLYEGFEGIILGQTEIRLHARRRSALLEDIEGKSRGLHTALSRSVSYAYAAEAVGQTAVFLGIAAAVAALAVFDARSLAGIIVVLVSMQPPLFALLATGPTIAQTEAVAGELEKFMGSLGDDAEPQQETECKPLAALELHDVRFKYRESQDAFDLGPIDLTIHPGEIVFVAGGNGSGKTTLAKVLVGLYPSEGRIVLNGKDIVTESDRELYRSQFAVVFADGFVFQELWGSSTDSIDERANAMLEELQLAHKVEVRGGRLSSTQLSQGQMKRLGLLAAYLEDRPILVFDEWAADQDPEFKRLFYTKYLPELKRAGKSAIVISHDDRYFGIADRVIHLERGRLVDAAAKISVTAG